MIAWLVVAVNWYHLLTDSQQQSINIIIIIIYLYIYMFNIVFNWLTWNVQPIQYCDSTFSACPLVRIWKEKFILIIFIVITAMRLKILWRGRKKRNRNRIDSIRFGNGGLFWIENIFQKKYAKHDNNRKNRYKNKIEWNQINSIDRFFFVSW